MVVKGKYSGSFTVIPNTTANDDQLSIDALGMLTFLISKPHNWQVNIANLRKRFGIGRDRAYSILKHLEGAGYVRKTQPKEGKSQQFCAVEYVVFDTPENARSEERPEPFPEYPVVGISMAFEEVASGLAGYGKQGHIIKKDTTKLLKDENSAEAGAIAPSLNSKIWKEGSEFLQQSPSPAGPNIIGKWLKRVPTTEGKAKLFAIIRSGVAAGTADPVAYVTAALAKHYPPLPDARTFDTAKWERIQRAAIKTKDWSAAWGPPPGKRGCLMPQHIATAELIAALATRKITVFSIASPWHLEKGNSHVV